MNKILIGIIGENGSGKDTFCEFLKEIHPSAQFIRFSDPLREMLSVLFEEIKREDQQWLANNLRERFGEDILTGAVERKIERSHNDLYVLNGIRVWEDFHFLKEKEGYLVYVTADQRTRWERLKKRGEKEDDGSSFEEFLKKEDNPTERDIPKIGKEAHFVVDNNGSLENLKEEALKIIKEINEKR